MLRRCLLLLPSTVSCLLLHVPAATVACYCVLFSTCTCSSLLLVVIVFACCCRALLLFDVMVMIVTACQSIIMIVCSVNDPCSYQGMICFLCVHEFRANHRDTPSSSSKSQGQVQPTNLQTSCHAAAMTHLRAMLSSPASSGSRHRVVRGFKWDTSTIHLQCQRFSLGTTSFPFWLAQTSRRESHRLSPLHG